MKDFRTLIDETLQAGDVEELESASDLFHYGIEKGYYTKRQADEFNDVYWKVKNRYLAYEVAGKVKGNTLDIITMVASAPLELKDNINELTNYVNGRMKALKGKIGGLK
jgi:hypothetical protein